MKKRQVRAMTTLLIVLCCLFIGTVKAKYKSEIPLGSFDLSIKANTQYMLTFDLNHHGGESESAPLAQTDPSGSFTIPAAPPTHKWGTFLGWTTDKEVVHKGYPYTNDYKEGLLQPGDNFTGRGGESVNNIVRYTLYAVWYLENTEQSNFEESVKKANGNEVIIGGGDWKTNNWDGFNPDISKKLNLTIWDGEFNGWMMNLTNTEVVINGGIFNGTATETVFVFWQNDGVKVTINGGDWSKLTGIQFIENNSPTRGYITGGIFGFDPSYHVPTGYTVVGNGDGTWTVQLA